MLERLDDLIGFVTVMMGVSLIITILNQIVAGFWGYRAAYLKDGIKDLLETLDPGLADHVEEIVNAVLTHKIASDSIFARKSWAPLRWRMATAIRPDEFSKLLRLVSAGKDYAGKIENILQQINPTVEREAELIASAMNKIASSNVAAASAATAAADQKTTTDQLIQQMSAAAGHPAGRMEAAFNSTMDRVSQRFTLLMRIWTVIFSLAIALICHLDAARIYAQASVDSTLRASLGDSSKNLIARYENIGNCDNNPAGQQPADGSTQDQEHSLVCRSESLVRTYRQVRTEISAPGVALFDVYPKWWHFSFSGMELLRVLATGAMLSLGAPFWYNALKSLVNLRSQLAEK